MAAEYSRNMIKVSIAKMLQTIGWNSIHSTPLEILTDISVQYIIQLAKTTNDYANEFGCVEPTLDHLGLSFRDHHVNLQELQEYVKYVDFAPAPTPVPMYPVPKENSLNFLKPGSKEVVTRPVHINEHLPPMCEDEVKSEPSVPIKMEAEEATQSDEATTPVFKRPAEVSPGDSFKRPRPSSEEEGRPTREISSVMMTTSGYISPAREGKLPESRTPVGVENVLLTPVVSASTSSVNAHPLEPVPLAPSQQPLSSPVISSTTSGSPSTSNTTPAKAPKLLNKKQDRPEKKKSSKELFKNGAASNGPAVGTSSEAKVGEKVKKQAAKEPKKPKSAAAANAAEGKGANSGIPHKTPTGGSKLNKALAVARLKTEKLNTTITPISTASNKSDKIDKLLTEPDKKKVNILKKISNVKNEKPEKTAKITSRESSPDLVIDEPKEENKLHISSDITIELVQTTAAKAPDTYDSNKGFYDDDSPPGTPSTPKTPEMLSQSPPIVREKKKRKDKTKVKKVLKGNSSPIREPETSSSNVDYDRPKTPQPHILPGPQFPLFPFTSGPGLIPGNPLFPMPPMMFGLSGAPNLPPLRPGFPRMVPPALNKPHLLDDDTPPKSIDKGFESDAEIDSPKSEIKKKKDKKDKIKKKNKKDKIKNKAEKRKLKEEKKDKIKKIKKEKRKDKEKDVREALEITVPKITLKLGTPSPRPDTPDTKKLNIKPIVKRESEEPKEAEVKRELSPELAKISALVTGQPKPKSSPVIPPKEEIKEEKVIASSQRGSHPGPGRPRIHPIKQKSLKPNKRPQQVKDSEGNVVWICPACGRQDDGTPMIGCDDCDAWYHWVCVGIQVPPDETENWYCRQCIVKKQENLQPDKKKKRKKREKKEH